MHSLIAFGLLGFIGLSSAHGNPAPKFVGGRKVLSDIMSRRLADETASREHLHRLVEEVRPSQQGATTDINVTRDNKSGKCGPGRGTCAAGYCCSFEGYDIPD